MTFRESAKIAFKQNFHFAAAMAEQGDPDAAKVAASMAAYFANDAEEKADLPELQIMSSSLEKTFNALDALQRFDAMMAQAEVYDATKIVFKSIRGIECP